MTKLQEIMNLCKCSVTLTVNNHRDVYEDIDEHIIDHLDYDWDTYPEDPDDINKMIELDTLIELQCYKDTPIGFFAMAHHDYDILLDNMLQALRSKK